MYRFCLWGTREAEIQVGSTEDRQLQLHFKYQAQMQRSIARFVEISAAINTVLLPYQERLCKSMEGFTRAIEKSRIW